MYTSRAIILPRHYICQKPFTHVAKPTLMTWKCILWKCSHRGYQFGCLYQNLSSKSAVQRERPTQLLLLVNSLYNLGRKSECIQWTEVSLHEAVLHYKRAATEQLQKDWAATLISLFDCINRYNCLYAYMYQLVCQLVSVFVCISKYIICFPVYLQQQCADLSVSLFQQVWLFLCLLIMDDLVACLVPQPLGFHSLALREKRSGRNWYL